LIVETARRIGSKQFVLDGEAVLLDLQGISDFDGLMARQQDEEVQLYGFDILALDGEDLRKLPLHLRKTPLARLLARRADDIHRAPFHYWHDVESLANAPHSKLERLASSALQEQPR
jgi:bifunctional non-homologous end joining protein LigD